MPLILTYLFVVLCLCFGWVYNAVWTFHQCGDAMLLGIVGIAFLQSGPSTASLRFCEGEG